MFDTSLDDHGPENCFFAYNEATGDYAVGYVDGRSEDDLRALVHDCQLLILTKHDARKCARDFRATFGGAK